MPTKGKLLYQLSLHYPSAALLFLLEAVEGVVEFNLLQIPVLNPLQDLPCHLQQAYSTVVVDPFWD